MVPPSDRKVVESDELGEFKIANSVGNSSIVPLKYTPQKNRQNIMKRFE